MSTSEQTIASTSLRPSALVLHGLLVAALGWLYLGDLARWIRAQSAEVTALNELPSLPLSIVGSIAALAAAGLLAVGLAQKRPATWRGFRLGPAAGVIILFFDFAVLSSTRSPFSSAEHAQLGVHLLADHASSGANVDGVPRDADLLATVLEDLGPPPFFVHGVRVPQWSIDVREACDGPASDAAGKGPGTLVYCVSRDRRHAYVTLVGVAAPAIFGPPAIVSTSAPWVGQVDALEPEAAPTPPENVWQLPTPTGEAPDSGR